MNGGLQGALVGVLGTLLIGWLVHQREKAKRASEEDRWYGELFLQREFDAISRLHEKLVDCHFSLGGFGIGISGEKLFGEARSRTEREKILDDFEAGLRGTQTELWRSFVVASIYLPEKDDAVLVEAVNGYQHAVWNIYLRIAIFKANAGGLASQSTFEFVRGEDADKFVATYRPAVACLKRLLTPQLPRGTTKTNTDTNADA